MAKADRPQVVFLHMQPTPTKPHTRKNSASSARLVRKHPERHLLVKQLPQYTSWILVRESEKANEHCQEEHYIDYKNAESIDDTLVSICGNASIQDLAICPNDLV